jgi:hypothetical protein
VLNDLSAISDDELRNGAMMTALAKLVTMCFKHARRRADFVEILGRWINVVREVAGAAHGLEALAQVMRYILEVNEHVERQALEALLEREIGPEAKDTIVTVGQQLIEQGRQQGIQQGIQQERQQERQRFQELLLRLLRQRFGDEVDANVEGRVAAGSIEQIETWTDRVLSAATLADLLAD